MTSKQFDRFVGQLAFIALDEDLGECWIWTGSRRAKVYGRFCEGKNKLAHRVSYEHFIGDIPVGTEVDHLCRQTLCMNPRHLEAVSHRKNVERGLVLGNQHGRGYVHSVVSRKLMAEKQRSAWTDERRVKMAAFKRLWWTRKREAA